METTDKQPIDPAQFNRRSADERVNTLVVDVSVLKEQMRENTEVTKQVRDILGTFRVSLAVAKWVAAIAAACGAVIALIKSGRA